MPVHTEGRKRIRHDLRVGIICQYTDIRGLMTHLTAVNGYIYAVSPGMDHAVYIIDIHDIVADACNFNHTRAPLLSIFIIP